MTKFYQLVFTETNYNQKDRYTDNTVCQPTQDRDQCIREAIELVVQDEGRAYQLLERDGETPLPWIADFIEKDPGLVTLPFIVKKEHECNQALLELLYDKIGGRRFGKYHNEEWTYEIHAWEISLDNPNKHPRIE